MRVHRTLLAAALLIAGALGVSFFTPQPAAAGGGFSIGFGSHYGFGHHRHFGHRHFYGYRHYPFYRRHYSPYRYRHYGYPYRPYGSRRYATPVLPPEPKQAPQQPPRAEEPSVAYDTSYCREYSRSAVIDGRKVEAYGKACRQSDGTWRIIN